MVLKNPEDCKGKWIYCITHQEIADYVHCFYHSEPNYLKKTILLVLYYEPIVKKEWEYKKQACSSGSRGEGGILPRNITRGDFVQSM